MSARRARRLDEGVAPAKAMAVKRIVANLAAEDVGAARGFYGDGLGLDLLMDQGWIATWGTGGPAGPQLSVLSEGGSGAPIPDLSIEVDDLDGALRRLSAQGFAPEYGPADEPWGVRRAFVRDPFGRLVNLVVHV